MQIDLAVLGTVKLEQNRKNSGLVQTPLIGQSLLTQ